MTYKIDKIFLFFFLISILSSFVFAQPPFEPQISGCASEAGTIMFSLQEAIPKDSNFNLYFHLYNSTGHLILNNISDCYVHIYDPETGEIILDKKLNKTLDGIDHETNISGILTNRYFSYPLNIWCNSTNNQAAFLSSFYTITNTGRDDPNSGEKWLVISLCLFFMTALLGFITFIIKDDRLYPIKMLFFILTVTNTLILGILAYLVSLNPFDVISYQKLGLGYASINIIVLLGFLYNYYFVGFGKIFRRSAKKLINKKDNFNNDKIIK